MLKILLPRFLHPQFFYSPGELCYVTAHLNNHSSDNWVLGQPVRIEGPHARGLIRIYKTQNVGVCVTVSGWLHQYEFMRMSTWRWGGVCANVLSRVKVNISVSVCPDWAGLCVCDGMASTSENLCKSCDFRWSSFRLVSSWWGSSLQSWLLINPASWKSHCCVVRSHVESGLALTLNKKDVMKWCYATSWSKPPLLCLFESWTGYHARETTWKDHVGAKTWDSMERKKNPNLPSTPIKHETCEWATLYVAAQPCPLMTAHSVDITWAEEPPSWA